MIDRVEHRRGLPLGERAVEGPAVGEPEDQVPQGLGVGRPAAAEGEERRPVVERQQRDRHVDREPGDDGRDRRAQPHPQLPRPQAEQEERAEHEQGVELRRHGQAEQHPGQHLALPRPRPHAQPGERDGEQVPVGEGVHQQQRGERDHRGVPRPPARQRHHRAGDQEGQQRQQQAGDDVVGLHVRDRGQQAVRPRDLAVGPGEPGRHGHQPAGQHRVLDRGVQVGDVALVEAVHPEERDGVVVAEVRVLDVTPPSSRRSRAPA